MQTYDKQLFCKILAHFLQKFVNFQKESDLISSEFDVQKRDLEDCEAALSEDNVLKNEIENRLQVINDRLIALKEAGITL